MFFKNYTKYLYNFFDGRKNKVQSSLERRQKKEWKSLGFESPFVYQYTLLTQPFFEKICLFFRYLGHSPIHGLQSFYVST